MTNAVCSLADDFNQAGQSQLQDALARDKFPIPFTKFYIKQLRVMMLNPAFLPYLSVDEYLLGEDGADCRHEYINGQVYAMTGASDRHGLITLNIATILRPHLRGTPCQLFANDMKVRLRIQEQDIFYYPDLLLSCDPADRATYYRTAPCLIVEVLSDSTERIDRREKLWAYQTLPSLQEYLLIAQHQRQVEIYRRANGWKPELVASGAISLACVALDITIDQIYEDIEL